MIDAIGKMTKKKANVNFLSIIKTRKKKKQTYQYQFYHGM